MRGLMSESEPRSRGGRNGASDGVVSWRGGGAMECVPGVRRVLGVPDVDDAGCAVLFAG